MATVIPPITTLLAEAQLAFHKLSTGQAVVQTRDSNGEQINYNLASAGNLQAYIQSLQDQINLAQDPKGRLDRASAPMRIWF